MTDLKYLSDLLPLLKLNGVRSIKMQGLELLFHAEQLPLPIPIKDSTQIIQDALKKQEEAMPQDLRADHLMDQDKVLHWSSPDQGPDQELPLTGEADL